jgi:hypothetical protein
MIHLAMVRVYLERGWHDLAVDRIVLLDRILQLEPDVAAREELRRIAQQHTASLPTLGHFAS